MGDYYVLAPDPSPIKGALQLSLVLLSFLLLHAWWIYICSELRTIIKKELRSVASKLIFIEFKLLMDFLSWTFSFEEIRQKFQREKK
jgi:hypothetical protein